MEVVYNQRKDRARLNLNDMRSSLEELEDLINAHCSSNEPCSKLVAQENSWLSKILSVFRIAI